MDDRYRAGQLVFCRRGDQLGTAYIGWETPERWMGLNDQGETNFHNTSALLDQLPRTLLSFAALVGGIMVPLLRIIRGRYPGRSSPSYWLWPTFVCMPAALFSLLVSWHEKLYRVLGVEIPPVLDVRAGEVKESLLALFIMFYVISIWYRKRISVHG